MSTNEFRNKPFIVVCGCTGTGKTKLSVQLAKWLHETGRKAEIINADAMQVLNLNIIPISIEKMTQISKTTSSIKT